MEKYAGDVRKQVSVAKEIARRFLTAAESNDEMDICGNMYTKADIAVCVSIAKSHACRTGVSMTRAWSGIFLSSGLRPR